MDKKQKDKATLKHECEQEIDWELAIQLQINELSCIAESEGVQRPGKLPNGNGTSSTLIYPVLAYDAVHCPYPTVIALYLTGLAGESTLVGYGKQELPKELKTCLEEVLEFEGLIAGVHWKVEFVVDVLLEARIATVLLPKDVLYAREHGWFELMSLVRQGERSTHRLAVSKLGRMALAVNGQKKAYRQLKEES